jgi:hypothetical protein
LQQIAQQQIRDASALLEADEAQRMHDEDATSMATAGMTSQLSKLEVRLGAQAAWMPAGGPRVGVPPAP